MIVPLSHEVTAKIDLTAKLESGKQEYHWNYDQSERDAWLSP